MSRQYLCRLGLAILTLGVVGSAFGQTYEWAAGEAGFGAPVHSLAVYDPGSGAAVYAGGEFASAGGHYSINHIARWTGADWYAVGGGLSNTPEALTVYGSDLIAGGWFTISGTTSLYHIGKWNGSSWSPLGSGIGASLADTVYALTVYDGDLIAGGLFTTASGVSANYIAKWNGTSWASLGPGMNDTAYALTMYGSNLFAGGRLTTPRGRSSACWARWESLLHGDLHGDGKVHVADVDLLVPVLVYQDADSCHLSTADMDRSGTAAGADIQLFISALLGG